jgi:hypothetical protein
MKRVNQGGYTMTKSNLASTMQTLLNISENDPAWPAIVADIGIDNLREIIMVLRVVYATHYCGSAAELADQAKENAARAKRLN